METLIKNKRTLLLRDCCDFETIYGVVVLKGEVKVKEFQDKIYEIKNSFDYDYWVIDDVLRKLHDIYDFEYFSWNGDLEI